VIAGEVLDGLTQGAGVVLFIWVLANQAGVPVPVTPSLLAAGALANRGTLSFDVILAVVVGAALAADLVWYSLGRWRGAQTLDIFRRLPKPRVPLEWAKGFFLAHRFGCLWGARFLPGLNPIGAGLAGATRLRPTRFLLSGFGSALAWAGAGYLLSAAIIR
jgi:membrane protein DedA with SNARE-associated domain